MRLRALNPVHDLGLARSQAAQHCARSAPRMVAVWYQLARRPAEWTTLVLCLLQVQRSLLPEHLVLMLQMR